jgi:integrase
MKRVLTDKSIKSLKPAPKGKRYYIVDTIVPGLGVRVTDKGHRTFILGARFPGSRHFARRELGEVGALGLADARTKARAWLEQIKAGIDPQAAEARTEKGTFRMVSEAYIARVLPTKRKAKSVTRIIRNELIPAWGESPIAEITRRDVVELIEAIADRRRGSGSHAHYVLATVRGLFNWAINRDIYGLEASPCDRVKPGQLIGTRKIRQRVLSDAELRALWLASLEMGYPFGSIIRALMLTGARLGEMAGARWGEFDLGNRLWTVPAERFKSDAQHMVPLTDDMVELVSSLPRWAGGDALFFRYRWAHLGQRFKLRKSKATSGSEAGGCRALDVPRYSTNSPHQTFRAPNS